MRASGEGIESGDDGELVMDHTSSNAANAAA